MLVVFLYIRMRRLEGHLHAVDATLDTLLAEAPPAEFLPSIQERLSALEKQAESDSAASDSDAAESDSDESASESEEPVTPRHAEPKDGAGEDD
jgi:hypothetical protein